MYVHSFIENGLVVLKKNIKIWKVTTTITTTTITNSVRKAHLSPTKEKKHTEIPFPPQKYDTFNLISTDYKAGSAGNSKAAVQLINFL